MWSSAYSGRTWACRHRSPERCECKKRSSFAVSLQCGSKSNDRSFRTSILTSLVRFSSANLYKRLDVSSKNGSIVCLDGAMHSLAVVANFFRRTVQIFASKRGSAITARGGKTAAGIGKYRIGQAAEFKLQEDGIISLKLDYCSQMQELKLWQTDTGEGETLLIHEKEFNLQYRLGVNVLDPINLHSRVCVAGSLGHPYAIYHGIDSTKTEGKGTIHLKRFVVDASPKANEVYRHILQESFQQTKQHYSKLCENWSKEMLKDSGGVLRYMKETMKLIAAEKRFWAHTERPNLNKPAGEGGSSIKLAETLISSLFSKLTEDELRDIAENKEIGLRNAALIEDIFIRHNIDAITDGLDFKSFLFEKNATSDSTSSFQRAFAFIVDVQFGASDKVVDKVITAFKQCIEETLLQHAGAGTRSTDLVEELVRLSYRLHNSFVVQCPSKLVKAELQMKFSTFLVELMNKERDGKLQLWERIEIFLDRSIQRVLKDKKAQECEELQRKAWDATELQLAMAFKLCVMLEEKEQDKFAVFYKQHLANRLLQSKDIDKDIRFEREAIVVFREILGKRYTQPLAGMVSDILNAKRFVVPFETFVRSGGKIVLPALKRSRSISTGAKEEAKGAIGAAGGRGGAAGPGANPKGGVIPAIRQFQNTVGKEDKDINADEDKDKNLNAEIAREVELEFDGGGMPYHWPCMRCTVSTDTRFTSRCAFP